MKLPAPADWLFSVKLFTAAMIAYWLSAAMGLPQSYHGGGWGEEDHYRQRARRGPYGRR